MKTEPVDPTRWVGRTFVLPDAHRRRISVSVHYLEKMAVLLEGLLRRDSPSMVTEDIEESFTEEQRSKMLVVLGEIRSGINDMVRTFNLEPAKRSESQIVLAQVTHLWTILIDSQSKTMRGFGELPEGVALALDPRVGKLIELLDELRAG